MKLSKQELAAIFDDASDFNGSNEQALDARKALLAGTLEIEGYERTRWTKFDPGNPETFPPCNYEWFLFAAQKPLEHPTFTVLPELATEALLERIRNDIIKFKLNVYWGPFPKPPVETERNKNDSK